MTACKESLAPIERITPNERAHLSLKQALLSGRTELGTTLTLRYFAEVLGTSVMPVREAIARLSAENALLVRLNCGIRVPLLDADAANEVWDLRLQLEGHAYRLAAQREKQQDLAAFHAFVISVNGARA